MSAMRIEIADERNSFYPGERLEGIVSWQVNERPESVELRLFWRTEGKGDQDLEIEGVVRYKNPSREDEEPFEFDLPNGPYSFSGKIISLIWGIELVVLPSGESRRLDLVVSPTGDEIVLGDRGEV